MVQQDKYEVFWQWFAQHQEALRAAALELQRTQQMGPLLEQLHQHMSQVNEHLAFLFGVGDPQSVEFVISGQGMSEAVDDVVSLHSAAPELPGWRYTAFRPRMPAEGSVIQVGGVTIDAAQVHAVVTKQGSRAALAVYLPRGLTMKSAETRQAIMLILDHTLGEYTVCKRIGAINFIEKTQPGPRALPMAKVVEEVDRMFLQ